MKNSSSSLFSNLLNKFASVVLAVIFVVMFLHEWEDANVIVTLLTKPYYFKLEAKKKEQAIII